MERLAQIYKIIFIRGKGPGCIVKNAVEIVLYNVIKVASLHTVCVCRGVMILTKLT